MLLPKERNREAFKHAIDENLFYQKQLSTLIMESTKEKENSLVSLDWSWLQQ
ncbi:hypothetical protein AB205_0182260 [Aquarana catesbeiana]|uniref:I-kappa-kinase-beta NEMO binding domain-containing protein n=2 Tax=Aquarana catesbeiana TaxID=8400 RepID=A0A2G9NBD7_AQUCT|nr:hypothetical protein AB205_0182260 [Aquarana catesbeiana]